MMMDATTPAKPLWLGSTEWLGPVPANATEPMQRAMQRAVLLRKSMNDVWRAALAEVPPGAQDLWCVPVSECSEIERLRAALLNCARLAERLKKPCGMDPESDQSVRNAQYQNISTTAHVALGTIRGPQGA